MAYIPVTKFGGGLTETQNPIDFLRDFGNLKRAEKIANTDWAEQVEDYLKAGSPADVWIRTEPTVSGPWAPFKAAFLDRFPAPEEATATPQEYDRQL